MDTKASNYQLLIYILLKMAGRLISGTSNMSLKEAGKMFRRRRGVG